LGCWGRFLIWRFAERRYDRCDTIAMVDQKYSPRRIKIKPSEPEPITAPPVMISVRAANECRLPPRNLCLILSVASVETLPATERVTSTTTGPNSYRDHRN